MGAVYVGWIPNIAGRLSFHTLSSSYLTTITRNISLLPVGPQTRFVIAYHRRVSNDEPSKAILRGLLVPFLGRIAYRLDWYRRDTFDHFALFRSGFDDENLVGKVYILRRGKVADQWLSEFDKLEHRTESAESIDRNSKIPLCEEFFRDIEKMAGEENPANFMDVKVILNRSGRCQVEADETGPPNWPRSPFERSNQAFRFVRDLFHSHYHHHVSDDAFTGLTPLDISNRWMRETDRTLYRAVLTARRRKNPIYLSEAMGRLAYLRAFRKGKEKYIPMRSLDHLSQSIEASRAQNDHMDAIWRIIFLIIISTPFALLELMTHLSESVLGHEVGRPGKVSDNAVSWAISSAYWTAAKHPGWVICFLLFIAAGYAWSSRLLRPSTWPVIRDLNRTFTVPIRLDSKTPYRILEIGAGLFVGFAIYWFVKS